MRIRFISRKVPHLPCAALPGLGREGLPRKAAADDLPVRFREIVSDPLILLIARDARAGVIEGDDVSLQTAIGWVYWAHSSIWPSFGGRMRVLIRVCGCGFPLYNRFKRLFEGSFPGGMNPEVPAERMAR